MESPHMDAIINMAESHDATEEEKRMLITMELAGQDDRLFGVEYVAREFDMEHASNTEKVDAFVAEGLRAQEELVAEIESLEDEYGDRADELLAWKPLRLKGEAFSLLFRKRRYKTEEDWTQHRQIIDGMLLVTSMPVERDTVRANSGEMFLDNLKDEYGDRLATQFLPFNEEWKSPD